MPETCENCRFWDSEARIDEYIGECRRFAPKPLLHGDKNSQAAWPETLAVDWCGEWAARAAPDVVEQVARAMMLVNARLPGNVSDLEYPVLTSDTDYDDLPRDHTGGTEDDNLTQEGVLRLAQAAIEAYLKGAAEAV